MVLFWIFEAISPIEIIVWRRLNLQQIFSPSLISESQVKFLSAIYKDADALIVNTAIDDSHEYQGAINNSNIYFLTPSKGKIDLSCIPTSESFKYLALQKYLLFLPAFSGCGTTAGFFRLLHSLEIIFTKRLSFRLHRYCWRDIYYSIVWRTQ